MNRSVLEWEKTEICSKKGEQYYLKQKLDFGKKRLYSAQEENGKLGLTANIIEKNTEADEEDDDLRGEEDSFKGLSQQSVRMSGIRGHPSGRLREAGRSAEMGHRRKKKQIRDHFEKEEKKKDAELIQGRLSAERSNIKESHERSAESEIQESLLKEAQEKRKRNRHQKDQKKKGSRLSFRNEERNGFCDAGAEVAGSVVSVSARSAGDYIHRKVQESEADNSALEGAHKAELAGERIGRYAFRLSRIPQRRGHSRWKESPVDTESKGRLRFEAAEEAGRMAGKQLAEAEQAKKRALQKFWQKQRIKKSYQAAKAGEQSVAEAVKASQTFLGKAKNAVKIITQNQKGFLGTVALIMLLFLTLSAGLSSCAMAMQGAATSIIGTTYPSTDEDIYAVEAAYTALENALNRQVNRMENTHPEYEEYRYQIDEISHNPYHLISYFTAKYGEFTYAQVAGEIEEIFRQQYGLYTDSTVETVTETKTVRVGESLGQVVTSAYCSCPICCGIWSGGSTASGKYPTPGHTLAVDASHPFVPMGTKIIMNGVEYVVEDTGAFASYGVQFDVYYADHSSALAHGHKTWEAFIADDNGKREVEVTTTTEVNRLDISLKNRSLDRVLRSRMNAEEEKRYDLYNTTYGNRSYLFDTNTLPGNSSGGFGYEIPSEALSDEKFANMIHEAEKYLGFPYVWGGASPSTSFDCSGFVSWVVNNCGNGWNVGRQTAEGLRGCCAYVSPTEARPGDLIFFEGTYQTSGASHVGIYVGDHMMIHCGEPIQYANIAAPYWQQHFMCYGRLP